MGVLEKIAIAAFDNEFQKTAGTGWNLHGYSGDVSEDDERAYADYSKRRSENAPVPHAPVAQKRSFLGRVFRRSTHKPISKQQTATYQKEVAAWRERDAQWRKSNPDVEDPYDKRRRLRVATPFDKKTNYKLNMNMDMNTGNRLDRYVSDFGLSTEGKRRKIEVSKLPEIAKHYRSAYKQYAKGAPNDPHVKPGATAFLQKLKYLQKNPSTKYVQLEYE